MKTVYLDNNATTPLHPEVKEEIIKALELYGNPSSFYEQGRKTRKAVEKARFEIASFINAKPQEIIFTGSGSEANNTVINSICCHTSQCRKKACKAKCHGKNHLITSKIEHPCILEASKAFEKRGFPVSFIPIKKNGLLNIEALKKAITKKTGLISVMMANNEIGSIQPIKKIAQIAQRNEIYIHSDAVQALGKIPIDVKDLNVNFLTLSAHKIYAPKGIGLLYIKEGTDVCPLIYGGHQEKSLRAGTENTIGIIAFGKAIEILKKEMTENNKKIKKLRDNLKNGILKSIPDVIINTDTKNAVPNTLNVTFKYVEGESILLYLDMEGIEVSTGSACSSDSLEPSHVIMALNVPVEYAHGSIRFSLGRENTQKDIDYVLEKLPPIIEKLRKMSSLKRD